MASRKKTLRYASGVSKKKGPDGICDIKWSSENIEQKGVKAYFNSLHILMRLRPMTRILLDVILMEMDNFNFIKNDMEFKKIVRYTMEEAGGEPMAHSTINNGFKELLGLGMLIKGKTYSRGKYRVNPLYYSKLSDSDRMKLLRRMREAPYKDKLDMLRYELLKSGKSKIKKG